MYSAPGCPDLSYDRFKRTWRLSLAHSKNSQPVEVLPAANTSDGTVRLCGEGCLALRSNRSNLFCSAVEISSQRRSRLSALIDGAAPYCLVTSVFSCLGKSKG